MIKLKKVILYNIDELFLFSYFYSHPNLLKGVYEMGYNAPSKIQETALPLLLANP
jgi:superfamily II DNA/RNA helicase